jgi:hypothetical protein
MTTDQRERERALASDARAGTYARALARQAVRDFLKRSRRELLVVIAFAAVVVAVLAALAPNDGVRGFVIGLGLAGTAGFVAYCTLLLSGAAPTFMGEYAEQWSAQELRPLTEHGWKLVNHFGLKRSDHDHVLVGPGGVIVVETKWTGGTWPEAPDDIRIRSAVRQVMEAAHQLAIWSPVSKEGVSDVQCAVVLWGAHADGDFPAEGRRHPDGPVVLRGRDLRAWALRRPRGALSPEQVDRIWAAMERQLGGRDVVERQRRPMPRSFEDLLKRAAGSAVLAGAALVLSAVLASHHLWPVFAAFPLVAAGVHVALRNRLPSRLWTWSVLVGSALLPLLVCVAVGYVWLREALT